jgi:3-deoxy-D-manno-octulosonate 8-phosphate phosphatase (KDO 8-P phosphatase)
MTAAPSNHGPGRPLPEAHVLAKIGLLLLDVDGVLTDGRVHFDHDGREYKSFHVHDAAGIVYWHRCGGLSGFLSGRGGEVVERRARELGVHEVLLGRTDKEAAFDDVLRRRGLREDAVAYVGDDLLDLPVLRRVAFAATVPTGRVEVQAAVHYVTGAPGGFGAVREVVELLLRARGVWHDVVRRGGRP